MRNPRIISALVVAVVAGSALVASPSTSAAPIGFGKSVLAGANVSKPTTLQFGPDDRLYVGLLDGSIDVFEVERDGPNDYSATRVQKITAVRSIPNHDDDGSLNASVDRRLLTGILVTGSASKPVIYATSSDPRIGAGKDGQDLGLDTNSGTLSRLTWTGSNWQHQIVVAGLPRSEENHTGNGMALDASTDTLFIAQGGNTNEGGPSDNFALLPEFALSAAILSIDLDAISGRYDLPTLNDPSRSGNPDANDPFGGNDGLNQAKIVPGGPVQVYAPGFRNPYDLVLTTKGHLFTADNGPNGGWGDRPVGEGTPSCTNGHVGQVESGTKDSLHLVTEGYYGGHANPTRGNVSNTFGGQSPVPPSQEDPRQCDLRKLGDPANTALADLARSTNGIDEYTTGNFGGAMKGDLVAASYTNGGVWRIELDGSGDDVAGAPTELFSNVGNHPLDLTVNGANDPFPGTIWVGELAQNEVIVFEPNDFDDAPPPCSGEDDPRLDEDGDGFDNHDEIVNGTDPCSGGDVPPDADEDSTSDLLDRDDDDDGLRDGTDRFAIDPANGRRTSLPVNLTWNNGAPPPGGLVNTGFTGLMVNGRDYLAKFDPQRMVVGGAAGVLTVERVSAGDALGTRNTQRYGFQLGVQPPRRGLVLRARVLSPFDGSSPGGLQSMGISLGAGTQSSYVKLVVHANGGEGGIQVVKEMSDRVRLRRMRTVAMPGPRAVDLFLVVKPRIGVQPSFRIVTGDGTSPLRRLGPPVRVPARWYDSDGVLAAGIISTSRGASPFPATWDLFRVTER